MSSVTNARMTIDRGYNINNDEACTSLSGITFMQRRVSFLMASSKENSPDTPIEDSEKSRPSDRVTPRSKAVTPSKAGTLRPFCCPPSRLRLSACLFSQRGI